MPRLTQMITATFGLAVLGACTVENGAMVTSWNQPAGAFLDEGQFGNPTMQNMLAQMCAGRSKGYIVPDQIVVLDPKSAPPAPPAYYRAQVRCSGDLNGKYAEVIFREYVESATAPPLAGQAEQTVLVSATGGE